MVAWPKPVGVRTQEKLTAAKQKEWSQNEEQVLSWITGKVLLSWKVGSQKLVYEKKIKIPGHVQTRWVKELLMLWNVNMSKKVEEMCGRQRAIVARGPWMHGSPPHHEPFSRTTVQPLPESLLPCPTRI